MPNSSILKKIFVLHSFTFVILFRTCKFLIFLSIFVNTRILEYRVVLYSWVPSPVLDTYSSWATTLLEKLARAVKSIPKQNILCLRNKHMYVLIVHYKVTVVSYYWNTNSIPSSWYDCDLYSLHLIFTISQLMWIRYMLNVKLIFK